MFAAWRHTRLWLTVLWSLVLAGGLAGWTAAERRLAETAASQPLLLLPEREFGDDERRQAASAFNGLPGLGSVRWIAPAELSRLLTRSMADPQWRALLPVDQSDWLPWLLEVTPADALDGLIQTENFVADRRREGGWAVLWDGDRLRSLLRIRFQMRSVLAMAAGLTLLIGAAGLATLPWPRPGGRGLWLWSALLGTAAPAAVAACAWLGGVTPGGRPTWIAAGVGFLLAGCVAPMLRQPRSSQSEKSKLSFMVREAPDERT